MSKIKAEMESLILTGLSFVLFLISASEEAFEKEDINPSYLKQSSFLY